MIPRNIKSLQQQSRGLKVSRVNKTTFSVESTTTPTASHIVTVEFGPSGHTVKARCTCEWAKHNGLACVHVMAALEYLANVKDRTLSFWRTLEDARRQKNKTFHLSNDREGIWITSRND